VTRGERSVKHATLGMKRACLERRIRNQQYGKLGSFTGKQLKTTTGKGGKRKSHSLSGKKGIQVGDERKNISGPCWIGEEVKRHKEAGSDAR